MTHSRPPYIALTLGPVVDTLSNTRATRELWAASYSLSYIMREIARELRTDRSREFVIPYILDDHLFADASLRPERYRLGAGVFPDRIIFRAAPNDSRETVRKMVDTVLDRLGENISDHISPKQPIQDQVSQYLRQYFQIDIVSMDLGENPKPIKTLAPYLNTAELQRQFPVEKGHFLNTFFSWVTRSFLAADAWGEPSHGFETLLEIATREFAGDEDYQRLTLKPKKNSQTADRQPVVADTDHGDTSYADKEQDAQDQDMDTHLLQVLAEKYKDRKRDGKVFKQVHKYIAIVHSDGDYVGKIIEAIEEKGTYTHAAFSKQMNAFALDAVRRVRDFGGVPVYAGGDDVLFFAPVVTAKSNIFSFLQELDEAFKVMLAEFKVEKPISQSFGLSISYYKHPLSEALGTSREQLFQVAKQQADGTRNNLSFKLLKHSGAYFGTTVHLPDASARLFMDLLKSAMENDTEELLRSIIYKLRESEKLIDLIGAEPAQVRAYLDNSFNESIHRQEPFKTFIDRVCDLIVEVYKEGEEEKMKSIYSLLRTVAFLTQKEEK